MRKKPARIYRKESLLTAPILLILVSIFLISILLFFPINPSTARQSNDKVVAVSSQETPSSELRKIMPPTPYQENLSGYCLRAPVLLYHHIQPQKNAKEKGQTSLSVDNIVFDSQMSYLTTHGYTTLTVSQLVDALRTHAKLPQKSIVITLDDGYKDAYEYAYPILKKYHIVANLAIPPGLLNRSDYMSWAQLEEISKSGFITVSDHTWSHASLPNISLDKASYEIDTARQQLEQHTGQKSNNIFFYPYGAFNSNIIKVLQAKGFLGAFSTNAGYMQCDSFIMSLHRNRVGNVSLASYGL